jgi:hypothetical protein
MAKETQTAVKPARIATTTNGTPATALTTVT